MEVEFFFGFFWKEFLFFEFIFKKLKKKIRKLKKNGFLILIILKEKRKLFLYLLKEIKNWFIKGILFLKEIINKFLKLKRNLILLFGFREVYELNEIKNEKNLLINNWIIYKFFILIWFMDWINYLLIEKKMKDLNVRIKIIRN